MFASQVKAIYGIVVLAISLPFIVSAQQYVGTPIANQTVLEYIPGANITWFNILDPNNKTATLTNYVSFNSSGNYMAPSAMKRLVIVIHGLRRDPYSYMSNMLVSISNTVNKEANIDNTQIVAPYFPNGEDKYVGYPWTDGLSPGKGSTSPELVWQASYWAQGANAQYPYNRPNVSSFAVLDQIINYYGDKSVYPNLNQIVVVGHSLGGQMTQRYAAVGKLFTTTVPVSYWIGNPNSYLWFNSSRPLDHSDCVSYNAWRDGFSNYTNTYQAAFASTPSKVLARYNTRRIHYGRGLQDTGDDSTNCAPYSQGQNRNERFFEFIKAFPPTSAHTVDYADCGHDFTCMSLSAGGQQRLWLDNFNGDGSFAPDFYCPRQQIGDDPNPSPLCGVTVSPANTGTYNGYAYKGCYTDQVPATLPYMAFSGWNNATVSLCTAACKAAGYSIAGLENANQCFCANGLGASVHGPLVEAGCGLPCAGNSSQICGDLNRLSIFSTQSNVTTYAAPMEPATISVSAGTYSYIGCYMEAISGRALGSDYSVSSTNTAESCVAYCGSKGYVYAGVEYSNECYCGNTIGSSAGIATSGCNMLCAGSNLEYCGGPNRLNVWYSNATVPATTTTSGSTSTVTSSSTSTATTLSCPASDGKSYTASSGDVFNIQCFVDHAGGDMGSVQVNSLDTCLNACASASGCVAVSYLPGSPGPCYMHNILTVGNSNSDVWGAVRSSNNSSTTSSSSSVAPISTSFNISSSASTVSVTSTSTASSPTATATLSCPSSNGARYRTANGNAYQVLCYLDNAGADLSQASASSLDSCLQICSITSGCVAVSWVPGSPGNCYLHSAFTTLVSNTGVYGARLITNSSSTTSSSASSSAIMTSSISSTSSRANSTSTMPIATSVSSSSTSSSSSLSSTSSSSSLSSSSSSSSLSSSSSSFSPSSSSLSSSLSTSSSILISTTSTGATSTITPTSVTSNSTKSTSTSSSKISSSTTTSTSASLPTGYTSLGCYSDSSTRTLPFQAYKNNSNTPTFCSRSCTSLGYPLSGTEYGNECWCGTTLNSSISTSNACTSACSGDSSQKCGGSFSLSIVNNTAYTPPVFVARASYATWSLDACYADSPSSRTLNNSVSLTTSLGTLSATVAHCLDACKAAGYRYCGLEYYSECYGSSMPLASRSLAGDPLAAGCNYACKGNATEACGGSNRVLVYVNNGTSPSVHARRHALAGRRLNW